MNGDGRLFAPATERNREPIASVLRQLLPASGMVLEVASGTGEHVVHFARLFPDLIWQPTDTEEGGLDSIRAWRDSAGLANIREPIALDAAGPWPVAAADAIVCINMVHISPWAATSGLMRGARHLLRPGAPLILYGPYRRDGVTTAPSNEAFDASLKARNPEWGLRDVSSVEREAAANGLDLDRTYEMPANNLILAFRRRDAPPAQ
ncbi:MAG: hypothetical protein JWP15_3595 [Alphaproteobacteria bacterium]|nr:hypothetical protein [Alphaproteobacteria bacterium]